ncbi:hypothetical protein FACS1894123_12070 [Bacteroidia bacterium]|nr:hypothetical protein FACS1894123_12070 [Bacteroidia bacterium]
MDEKTSGNKEKLYLGGDYYTASAVYVKEGSGNWNIYYICRDYLGSITHVTNSSGSVTQELSYDAWGRLRNSATQAAYNPGSEPALFLDRGYAGHEHLTRFGLVNMNARLYDPAVGRFLSPDPYVQMPDFSQNFNRYSYALNNPLKYTDPSGEFLFGFAAGFWKGLFNGDNVIKSAWQGAVNEEKIRWGLFKGSPKQILSRFTWELPNSFSGYVYAQFSNYAGQVDKVNYWGGATVTNGRNWGHKAATLGSFIMGDRTIAADPNNPLFQHEYGHYLQSQGMGWGYLSRVAIPSVMSAGKKDGNHDFRPFEQDANRRAFMYFNKNVEGFYQTETEYRQNRNNNVDKGWNFHENPMYVNGIASLSRANYYDYNNPEHLALINSLSLSAKWYDFAAWAIPVVGTIGVGLGNGVHYNGKKIR